MESDLAGEVAELLQQMIRNACVNDGSPESGHEHRSAEVLRAVLERPGLDLQVFEPLPGRSSLVARIEGRQPGAPSLALLGHTDVVPANGDDWRHDPFGGELIDGEVWGRGAVDMLNLTASMAVAVRHLADDGFRPQGDLVFIGVADEEALGIHGAEWLTTNTPEQVRADYLITEAGGFPMQSPDGVRLPVITGEKGVFWCTLTVRGTPGHASQPLRTDNALVKAAEVVRRLAEYQPAADIHDAWRRFVEGIGLPPDIAGPLLDPGAIDAFCHEFPALGLARQAHACTHTTMAPTVMQAGTKVNVIPDRVRLDVDIRTLPGWDKPEVDAMLRDALGDLADDVEATWNFTDPASTSPADTPLWNSLERVARRSYPDARCVPFLTVGATDARFFRKLGTVAYGFGLFSKRLTFEDYATMFHGVDERVDVTSLGLSAELWDGVARDTLV
ncbi:MAG TPA: M20/M25/M40 family metallo-hydrolase [Acidimicrobiales bacterium]|nr:M20/M25/M40 family metallo-hydrolase [Acidimicrobiales bacterium]